MYGSEGKYEFSRAFFLASTATIWERRQDRRSVINRSDEVRRASWSILEQIIGDAFEVVSSFYGPPKLHHTRDCFSINSFSMRAPTSSCVRTSARSICAKPFSTSLMNHSS